MNKQAYQKSFNKELEKIALKGSTVASALAKRMKEVPFINREPLRGIILPLMRRKKSIKPGSIWHTFAKYMFDNVRWFKNLKF